MSKPRGRGLYDVDCPATNFSWSLLRLEHLTLRYSLNCLSGIKGSFVDRWMLYCTSVSLFISSSTALQYCAKIS
jgi:hypothetical protein